MHKEILSKKQQGMLPELKIFSQNYGLVGGTAIALHLGHRQSIDFDLASLNAIDTAALRNKIQNFGKIETVIMDNTEEYTLIVNGVKFTFFHYPFPIIFSEKINEIISTPDITALAAMKAYTLGRRAKWKDYVDLYCIIKKIGSLDPIIKKAKEIYKKEFNEKNFRSELAYFEDIDFSEKIIYTKGHEINNEEIKKTLTEHSL